MVVNRSEVAGIDKRYVAEAILIEHQIQELLDEWEAENDRVIQGYTTSSGINRPAELIGELEILVAAYILAFSRLMDSGISRVAKAKASSLLEESAPILRMAKDNVGLAYFRSDMASFDVTMAKLWRNIPTGQYDLTFNDRLVALETSSKKVISNIVNLSAQQKLTPQKFRDLIRNYINPKDSATRPWDISRSLLGAAKDYVPKDVLAGSVQTSMYMLQRNVSSEIWREMTSIAYKDAQWVKGFEWRLSRSHPKPDICDDHAAASPYAPTDERPYSHPHCLCDWIAIMRTMNEIMEILRRGGTLYNRNQR